MDFNNGGFSNNTDVGSSARIIIGICLVVIGLLITFWVLQNVYSLITDTKQVPLIQKFAPKDPQTRCIKTKWGDFELPANYFLLLGYGVMFLLLTIVASVANNLIKVGAYMLQPDVRNILGKIKDEIVRTKKQ